jgi:hypothetical protein
MPVEVTVRPDPAPGIPAPPAEWVSVDDLRALLTGMMSPPSWPLGRGGGRPNPFPLGVGPRTECVYPPSVHLFPGQTVGLPGFALPIGWGCPTMNSEAGEGNLWDAWCPLGYLGGSDRELMARTHSGG